MRLVRVVMLSARVTSRSWCFRGMGEPKAGLNNAIVVGAVNLVLDPVLMFGCGLGVAGAAMATAAAQWVRPFFLPLFSCVLCLDTRLSCRPSAPSGVEYVNLSVY